MRLWHGRGLQEGCGGSVDACEEALDAADDGAQEAPIRFLRSTFNEQMGSD